MQNMVICVPNEMYSILHYNKIEDEDSQENN